jgi:uncharacterized membrane protein
MIVERSEMLNSTGNFVVDTFKQVFSGIVSGIIIALIIVGIIGLCFLLLWLDSIGFFNKPNI